jgi:LPS export ABC transporter protein LptC
MTSGFRNIKLIKLINKKTFFCAGILIKCFLITGCENDLKDVEEISSQKLAVSVEKSYGVEVLYSDSAKVKAKLIAPEVLHFKTKDPYYEMPKGITIIFFDENQKESGRTTSDYAKRKEIQKIVELKKNVVVVNSKGQTLKSEEVIWDENKHRFYSDKVVTLTSPDGSILYGTGFWADENLKNYNIYQATGNINVSQKEGF